MRKQIASGLALYLSGLILFLLIWIRSGEVIALAGLMIWFLIPFVSGIINYLIKNKISASIQVPPSSAKNKEVTCKVVLRNKSRFGAGHALLMIRITNQLTREVTEKILKISGASGRNEAEFTFTVPHAGVVRAELKSLALMDWFGFLSVRCKAKAGGKITVLPDTFDAQVQVSLISQAADDAETWSQERSGDDFSEVFALRDYVPGDSLKQIHWKLSGKRGEMIVRIPSLPTAKSILVFWDKNAAKAKPEQMDAMAESVASICQAMTAEGYLYTLGWTEGKELMSEEIETEDQLLQAIPSMLKRGADPDGESGVSQYAREGKKPYGKAICFAADLPDGMDDFPVRETSLILFTKEERQTGGYTISVSPEDYIEVLSAIDL